MYNLVISRLETLSPSSSQVLIPYLTRQDNSLMRLFGIVAKASKETYEPIQWMIYELTSGLPYTASGFVQPNRFPRKVRKSCAVE